ncbi:MAG: hypothetical protein Q8903_13920 [Bacteroidota bacterium]|nr:hypothetical protein [Bacteroidota bacterium]
MKKIITFLLSLFILSARCYPQIFCLADAKFEINRIALIAGLETSYKITFDIERFSPKNIKIVGLDSNSISYHPFYEDVTKKNLAKITYLKDTSNITIIFKYFIYPPDKLNNDFAIMPSSHEIDFGFVSEPIDTTYRGCITWVMSPEIDSAVVVDYIDYKNGEAISSDILVERVFNANSDSIIIIKNNYAELAADIIKLSKDYKKDNFLSFAPNSKKYFIRFKVRRKIDNCGYQLIL